MKISTLTEMATPASMPDNNTAAPKFGRSDEMLESDAGSGASTTASAVATNMDVKKRGGKKSIFQGIKTSEKYANSRKAGISEDAINEDDLSEEQLQAKKKREDLFNRAKDRDIGNRPKSREIMARESEIDDNPKPGSWQEIAKLNNITDPRKLQADKSITLPNGDSYYVNKGDTLSGIANRLKTTGDPQYGEPGSSTVTKPAMYVGGVNKRMAGPDVRPDSASTKDTSVALPRYPDSVYDYKPEVSTSSSNTIHPPGTSITAKIRDPKAPSWPLDVNLTKDTDGNWRNEKGQVHNFRVPGDKEQLEKMPALPPNQSSAETKRLNSIPKNKEPDIHSQAAQDAQWEKDKENMGKVWDEFKGWVKKPRSFTIVPGKGKPAFDPDPTHAVGRQIIPSNGQNIGLWPDELVDRYKSMTGAKDDAKSKDDTKIKQKPTTDKTSSVDPKLSTYHKVIAGIESGNRNFDKKGNPVVSPKEAKFAMQVKPTTSRDPGFGVVPAKDDSPEEYNRVGRDYFDAMMIKYNGDTQKASAAYNAGPGRVDSKIAKAEKTGKDWKDLLPRETRNYLKKFNKGIEVASNNDSMNEDISQKYARDYEYILEYLLSEGRIMTPQEKSEFDSQADYGGEDPDARDKYGNLKRSTSPGLGGSIDIGGVDIPFDAVDAGLGSMGAVAAMGSMKGGGLRPGLQKQQAQQKTTAEFDKFLKGGSGTVFNPQTKINTSATPKVMRGRNDPGFDPNLSTKGTMTGLTSPVDAKVKPDSAVSTYNPKTKTWSPGPDPAIKSSNVNVKPVNTTPKYDPKLDASNYNARGDYVGPPGTNTMTDKGKTNAGGNLRPGKQRIKDKEDREQSQRNDPDNMFKSQADPGLPFKPIPPKFDTTTGKKIDPLNGLPNFYYESTISRIGDEYEQILESMIGMTKNQINELDRKTVKSYVRKQPERIKGPTGLARTDPDKASRIVDPEKGDIRRALTKLKDPSYGKQKPRTGDQGVAEDFDDTHPYDSYVSTNRTVTRTGGNDKLSDRTASLDTDRFGNQRVRAVDGDKLTINTNIPKGVNVKMIPQSNTEVQKNYKESHDMGGQVVFSGTGDNGGKYEIIQFGDDFMIHANGKHIDSYGSLQRAMRVLQNEVPGLTKTVAEEKPGLWPNVHAKRERIKNGSGERMRKPGSKGAPTADALKKSAK